MQLCTFDASSMVWKVNIANMCKDGCSCDDVFVLGVGKRAFPDISQNYSLEFSKIVSGGNPEKTCLFTRVLVKANTISL